MTTIQEQIAQARNAGYDDAAITKHLSTLPDYSSKVKTALDSGYKPADILSYLEGPPKRQNVAPEKGNMFSQNAEDIQYSPEGIPLNTSNYGSAPTGATATATKALTTAAGVPVNYAICN